VEDRKNEVNLLVLEDKHYVLIKGLSRLLSSQISNHNGKKHFCLRCLNSFTTKEVLEKNREYCEDHDFIKIVMPTKITTEKCGLQLLFTPILNVAQKKFIALNQSPLACIPYFPNAC